MPSHVTGELLARSFLAAIGCLSLAGAVFAQLPPGASPIMTDGTLGPAARPVIPVSSDFALGAELGRQVGSNLFHSFSVFNIPTGFSATFSGPGGISNVISRVTGGLPSAIDGTLRSTMTGANVFLLNPKGVMFGPNARLDITGSFSTSTADYLKLGTDGRFDATNPAATVLSMAPPSAFGFVGTSPASIQGLGSVLQVPAGSNLSFVGGNVAFTGSQLIAPAGSLGIASLAAPGEVALAGRDLVMPADAARGAVAINQSLLSVDSANFLPAGKVVIRGGSLQLADAYATSINASFAPGGGIVVDLTGELSMNRAHLISATIGPGAAGDIRVSAAAASLSGAPVDFGSADLFADDARQLVDQRFGLAAILSSLRLEDALIGSYTALGPGGRVVVTTSGAMTMQGGFILSNAGGAGPGGDIDMTSGNMSMNGQSMIATVTTNARGGALNVATGTLSIIDSTMGTATLGAGDGGAVNVSARTAVDLETRSAVGAGLGSLALGSATGNAGRVTVTSPSLTLAYGAITGNNYGSGVGGDIVVNADNVSIFGGAISSDSHGEGPGGLITLNVAETLRVQPPTPQGAAYVLTQALWSGDAGKMRITARDIFVSGHAALRSATLGDGKAGNIEIQTARMSLTGGGQVDSSSSGVGPAGNISIAASESLTLSGRHADGFTSGLFSFSNGPGPGGNILVTAPAIALNDAAIRADASASGSAGTVILGAARLSLADAARISTSTAGSGRGGAIDVAASESVSLNGASVISASSFGSGNAGNININAGAALTLSGSSITTQAVSADGGNIDLKATQVVRLDNSRISTAVGTGAGNGGNITIDPTFVILDNSQIIADAFGGSGGNILIVTEALLQSGNSVIDASSQFGTQGTIQITSPSSDLTGGLTPLPGGLFDPALLLRESCSARAVRGGGNSFVGVGRGGIPDRPGAFAFSAYGSEGAGGTARNGPTGFALASAPSVTACTR